jgi:hypothetical protein
MRELILGIAVVTVIFVTKHESNTILVQCVIKTPPILSGHRYLIVSFSAVAKIHVQIELSKLRLNHAHMTSLIRFQRTTCVVEHRR